MSLAVRLVRRFLSSVGLAIEDKNIVLPFVAQLDMHLQERLHDKSLKKQSKPNLIIVIEANVTDNPTNKKA
jgi:hypothetical protein